jgi:hypothetical protein
MAKKLEFHFKGGSAEDHQLPIEFMINLLNNIRELTYLIIAQAQGVLFNERFKPSKQIKDSCIIKCELPQRGSYAQAISFDYTGQGLCQDTIKPFEKIEETLRFIADADDSKIIHSFPNVKMRSRALSCIRQALPQSDSNVYVEIANANANMIDSRVIQKNITAIIDRTQAVVEEYMAVVTGYLTSIDFAEKKIVVIHPVTKRSLDCFYNEEIEDMLFENRRQLVQITGMVMLDENDQPKRITDVVSIQEIDLSPIEFDCIDYEGKKLCFKNRLVLVPELDDSEQLYTISYPEFKLVTFAYTRQEITDNIKSDIAYLWYEYAKASDDTLTEDALELKRKMLLSIEELSDA